MRGQNGVDILLLSDSSFFLGVGISPAPSKYLPGTAHILGKLCPEASPQGFQLCLAALGLDWKGLLFVPQA